MREKGLKSIEFIWNIGFHKMFHVSQENGKKLAIDMAVLPGRYSQFLSFVIIILGIYRKSVIKSY